MGVTLRVGFAMGGGVSLGTFSGAALSQALKLLLLRGVDRRGEPYARVEVDVFSGASAGSMALSLMLRGLTCPDPVREPAAAARLAEEFGAEFRDLAPEAKRALVAAQILQDVQEEVWVREISLEKLLAKDGESDAGHRLRHTAGLVDRGAVEELARRYLAFPGGSAPGNGGEAGSHPDSGGSSGGIDLSHRRILADRVLFAHSMANLTPLVADASREYPVDELGVLGLSDGMTSHVHRELRVFDLHFTRVDADSLTDADAFPRRWCRYHAGPKVVDEGGTGRGIGSLFEHRGWAKMAATSLASGAFPLAFEPVPLERRSYEFGATEEGATSLWPKRLRGRDRHVFTYVDGGTFLNEPIREAFRLAAFIDAQSPEEGFERLVIFVDPHLVVPDPSPFLPHHAQWILPEPNRLLGWLRAPGLDRRTSLDRLVPLAGTVAHAILNESRVVEADKVFQTRKRFQLRNQIREELDAALDRSPATSVLASLAARLEELLAADRVGLMIPAGALTLEGEIRRVLAEERRAAEEDAEGDGPGGPPLLAGLRDKTPDEVRAFLSSPGSVPPNELGDWLRALTFAAVDRVMDLEGKMERSRLVAISPATNPARPGDLVELPGRRVGGFGGFMSELAGEHEVQVARYCAQLFLESARRIRPEPLPGLPGFSGGKEEQYLREVREGLKQLEDRLARLLAESHVDLLGAIPPRVLRLFLGGKLTGLAREKKDATAWELRLEVPDMSYEFDGEGLADDDIRPRRIGGKLFLITFATYTRGEPRPWSGTHVIRRQRALKVDRDRKGPLPDRLFCTVALPTLEMLNAAASLPYPVWVARIETTDEGTRVPSGRWQLLEEIRGLEETILG
jgi:predicted acylesterase/phospholipase RssA